MNQFAVVDDRLQVGNEPLTTLAARVRRSPFFVYERRLLDQRVAALRSALPDDIHLHYAVKANPMSALVQYMLGLVDGVDVASAGELQLALAAGADPATVSFAGPGKMSWELRRAIAAGVVINLESAHELECVAAIARELGCGQQPRVALRVNPDFELKASGMKMGGGATPFGVDAEQAPALLARLGELRSELQFVGLQIYAGSQNLHADALIEAQRKTLELGMQLAEFAPGPVRLFNIGGGFGIPYFPGDQHLDLTAVGANLRALMPTVRQRLPHAQLVIELGRYLVGEAGLYVVEVIDRKISRGQTFLITNGGLHHQLAATGNFGQIIRKNFPLALADRVYGGVREVVNVVGPLCTPLDRLGDKVELGQAKIGDLIVVFQSGAYARSASPAAFLSHPEALEMLI